LKDLLSGSGYSDANKTSFLQLTQSGDNAVLKVDVQGQGDFTTPEETITIVYGWTTGGFNGSWVDLIGHQIIVA